jgi:hypothetical protein
MDDGVLVDMALLIEVAGPERAPPQVVRRLPPSSVTAPHPAAETPNAHPP